MAGKNLTFKLVMDADVKNYVSNIKQSESVTKSVLTTIKAESDRLKNASGGAAEGLNALSNEARSTAQHVSTLDQAIGQANTELAQTHTAAQTAQQGIAGLRTGYTALVGAMGALGIGLGVRELAEAADLYTNLSARINIATKDGGDFTSAMAGVHQVALATNSSLEATGSLFARLNAVGKDMGMTQQQALDLTKTVTQAIQVGGGSAQASEAAVQQFIQAMQGGVLRGEEFNSIMENGYGVAEALAKGLGVTTGELRKMAENGELGAERVVKALQSQAGQIQETYNQFPTTISNALQKIATSWQILIGEMDQANGASATVADWLSTLADNMDVVEILLKDIGEGFVWVGDQLKKVDPATIDALKKALSTAYESLKDMGSTMGEGFERSVDLINTALGSIFDFDSGIDTATDKTNGFTKALQALNVVFGFIGDGFNAINIVANLLTGVFYDVTAAWLNLKSKFTWGDTKKAIIADMKEMALKAQDYYDRGSNGAMEFKSKGIEAINDISKTQAQKNQEALADNKATLVELSLQNIALNQKAKALSEERAALDKQLNQARKDGNQSTIDAIIQKSNELEGREKEHATNKAALDKDMLGSAQDYAEAAIKANGGVMDGVMQADLLTKGYIVTIDQAGKVSVQAGESAAQSAENAKAKEEALKLAKENVKKADEEYLAFQKQAAIERAALDQQIQQAKASGDLNELKQAQDKVNQINAKEAELANNRNLRIAELNQATTGSGKVAESAYSRASAAANQFGVDLDVSLNKVSKSFTASGNGLTELQTKLNNAGVTGQNAANVLYQAWESWLNKAKSPAEIDAANAKLREFEAQGVFSTKQVELGIMAIRNANAKLPDELDETGKAFERLGIKTKEQLKLTAQQAVMDYIRVRDSGKATAEGVDSAYQKMMQTVAASGDVGVIAAANTAGANRDLRIEIDTTGKASVKSMDEWSKANDRVRDSAHGIGDGYRQAGQVAREEAQSA
ncbi:tape measure protein, partial [Acinetobacter sp. BSP-28]|uniref:tape measure protein n=1 Tax=Acinetobacter sp. BSP-28 TaxID=3344661 RepID=UPI00376FFA8E